ncbi:MAG: hypothetical protein DLM54_11205 [Acidimicrobiales bacterium]|nr:MAG: hypothetical protein DLM54_11205 [Acidimicrobiales bacterium]
MDHAPRLTGLARAAAIALGVVAVAGCTSSSPAKAGDPRALLTKAKSTLDATSAIHFTLSSSGVGGSGLALVGGAGDVARPAAFRGTLMLSQGGASLDVKAISVGGRVYAQLPFTNGYTVAKPSEFGVSDPARLIDPNTGITSLLTSVNSATPAPSDRYQGETLDEVSVTLPAARVASVLDTTQRSGEVRGTIGIDPTSDQLRRVVLTGPLLDKSKNVTYTLVLEDYGEKVTITPPPT